jgi:hypothetical protein
LLCQCSASRPLLGRQVSCSFHVISCPFPGDRARLQYHCLAVCALLEVCEGACRVFKQKRGSHRDPDCPGGEQFAEACPRALISLFWVGT